MLYIKTPKSTPLIKHTPCQECHDVQVPQANPVTKEQCITATEEECTSNTVKLFPKGDKPVTLAFIDPVPRQKCNTEYGRECHTECKKKRHTRDKQACDTMAEPKVDGATQTKVPCRCQEAMHNCNREGMHLQCSETCSPRGTNQ